MKIIPKYVAAISVFVLAFLFNIHATTNVSLSIDNRTNAVLHWPSQTNQAFIIGYRTTLNPVTPWTLLTNVLATTNVVQSAFIHKSAITSSTTGFYVISEFSEDFDGDAVDNGTEFIIDTDPFVVDNISDASYPSAPSVYSGEVVFNYDTNSGTAPNLGPFLYANDTVANTMVTTEPTSGELHLKWTSAVVDHSGFLIVPLDASPTPNFTPEEAVILRDAFGEGTRISQGLISAPDQAKVNQVPIELLQRYEEFAIAQMDYNFKVIQAVNSGEKVVADIAATTRAQLASIHTQWTRAQAISRSLQSRIGRAIGKVLPLLGGVFIIANSAVNAQDFIDAAQDYSNDILNGSDETGSAAIFAGVCNNIAPGSGNLVLGYLLR